MDISRSYTVLGLMSGTSLDGVDAALCSFTQNGKDWSYDLLFAETISYSPTWRKALSGAFEMSARDLVKLDMEYGKYLGNICQRILKKTKGGVELIASHGHTVFHDPKNSYTFQIGNGANIASKSGITVVNNFRISDVAYGGQGAPLVPVGDYFLFKEYQACLNLGGFANISFDLNAKRIAFDICPVNIALNYLSQKLGEEYDVNGEKGRSGKVINALLNNLNELSFYKQSAPKSLGREWLESKFLPMLIKDRSSNSDKLRTVYQHIADQLGYIFKTYSLKNVIITGGGVHNRFLMELLQQKSGIEIVIPDDKTIDFKEAIIFAFLGLLRRMNKINCFSSVTGASMDTSCGTIYIP